MDHFIERGGIRLNKRPITWKRDEESKGKTMSRLRWGGVTNCLGKRGISVSWDGTKGEERGPFPPCLIKKKWEEEEGQVS